MTNSCKKGKAGERELANTLKEQFGLATRRGQQHTGLEGQDVVGIPGIHIECKRVEKLNLHDAVKQADRDAGVSVIPAVFHRKNKTPWLVTIQLTDLSEFCERFLEACRVQGTDQRTGEPLPQSVDALHVQPSAEQHQEGGGV